MLQQLADPLSQHVAPKRPRSAGSLAASAAAAAPVWKRVRAAEAVLPEAQYAAHLD